MKTKKENTRKLISDVQLNLELKSYFENSITDKTNLYELIRTKYRIGKQRCLNAYDLAIEEWRILKQKATNEQIVDSTKETLKKAILSKDDALEILTQIAKGKAKKVEGQIIMPSYAEINGAIKTMADLQGWKSPTKSEIDLKGEFTTKPPIDYSKLSTSALEEIIKLAENTEN